MLNKNICRGQGWELGRTQIDVANKKSLTLKHSQENKQTEKPNSCVNCMEQHFSSRRCITEAKRVRNWTGYLLSNVIILIVTLCMYISCLTLHFKSYEETNIMMLLDSQIAFLSKIFGEKSDKLLSFFLTPSLFPPSFDPVSTRMMYTSVIFRPHNHCNDNI